MSRELELINELKELEHFNKKFLELKTLVSATTLEVTADFNVPRRGKYIENVKLNQTLLRDYVNSELISIRKQKALVYQKLGEYVEVEEDGK